MTKAQSGTRISVWNVSFTWVEKERTFFIIFIGEGGGGQSSRALTEARFFSAGITVQGWLTMFSFSDK